MNKTVPIRTKPEIQGFLRRLREWNANYYIAAVIGIQWGLRCWVCDKFVGGCTTTYKYILQKTLGVARL